MLIRGPNLESLIGSAYAVGLVASLDRKGLWQGTGDIDVASVARKNDWDPRSLEGLLEFVASVSDVVVRRRRGIFRLAARYRQYSSFGHLLDKYVRAYLPVVMGAASCLENPARGKQLVKRKTLSRAFEQLGSVSAHLPASVLRTLGVQRLLDLGSGAGGLLNELARSASDFEGWGIDESSEMCAAARRASHAIGADRRIHILCGDALAVAGGIALDVRKAIDCVYAGSFLNEYFSGSGTGAIRFLTELRRLFPGRLLVVKDYYGGLGCRRRVRDCGPTLTHDLVQLLTGQGVPPPSRSAWGRVYRRAGLRLRQWLEGSNNGIRWFVHVVRM